MLAITNGRIITENQILKDKCIIINDGKILDVGDTLPEGIKTIDAEGNYVSPGFIDIHIHGAGGYDTMDGSYQSLNNISMIMASHGVTSFLPTTTTMGAENIKNALKAIKLSVEQGMAGAEVIGAHLEGPFLNPKAKGSHDPGFLLKPDINLFLELAGDELSIIKRVTIAPEVDGAHDLIRFMNGHGIVISIGHSDGSYDNIMDAIGIGASHSTHLFNAMRAFSHREPGVVGAILDSSISTEFIADGIHLHFASIRTALTVKGYNKCALVTDAMRACTMEDGVYSLGGREVFVRDGAARLSDGTLAGSTLTLDRAVKNIMKNTSLNIIEATAMATSVPAEICKIDNRKGYIRPGYDGDIVIFDPEIKVIKTIVGGKVVY